MKLIKSFMSNVGRCGEARRWALLSSVDAMARAVTSGENVSGITSSALANEFMSSPNSSSTKDLADLREKDSMLSASFTLHLRSPSLSPRASARSSPEVCVASLSVLNPNAVFFFS